jgi:hypothetical protein
MLRSVKDLEGFSLGATDGDIGTVKDFYFDDGAWVIRYVVAETGNWFNSRKVLISPMSIGIPEMDKKVLPTRLQRQQVKDSPDIDTDQPVSRQHERDTLRYYDYPYYWGGYGYWGDGLIPSGIVAGNGMQPEDATERAILDEAYDKIDRARHEKDDPHLRSCNAVISCAIAAMDGDIGHVSSMLVDDETWAIRYLVVQTGNWGMGQQVLIAPLWIKDVSWDKQTVSVNLTREAIKNSPLYNASAALERSHEAAMYTHYGQPGYWESEAKMREVKAQRAHRAVAEQ